MKNKIEFFKSYYENQHARREKIYEQFFYFAGLLTLQIGFLGYYLLNFPTYKSEDSFLYYFFIFTLLIVGGLIVKIFSIIHLWTKDKTYAEFGKPNDIKIYIDKLSSFNDKKNKIWKKYLLNEYVRISNHNTSINEDRHSLNMEIRKYLIKVLYSLIFSFLPYFFLMGNELNSQKIIILNQEQKINEEFLESDKKVIDDEASISNEEKRKYSTKPIIEKRDKIMINLFNCNKHIFKKQNLNFNDKGFILYQSSKDINAKKRN